MAQQLATFEDMLTDQEFRLVEAIATLGMSQRVAAQFAGYQSQQGVITALNKPLVVQAIADQRAANAEALNLTREKLHLQLNEAVELARTLGDPAAMIRGLRERGLIAGFYDESPDARRGTTDVQRRVIDRIKEMTDEDLIAMAAKEVKGVTIEQAPSPVREPEAPDTGAVQEAQSEDHSGAQDAGARRDQPQATRGVPRAKPKAKAPEVEKKLGRDRRAAKRQPARKVSNGR